MDEKSRTVTGGSMISGTVAVPGDKSISHRALMLGAVAQGVTNIDNLSRGGDVASTKGALRALGVPIDDSSDRVTVHGRGGRLDEPEEPLDLGNAGTGMRLMCGLVAARQMMCILTGDSSLRSRPMSRVLTPLTAMGGRFVSRSNGLAPLVSLPSEKLSGITYSPPVSSAQVKGAVLLAGLRALGSTTVHESVRTRPHTEEMLIQFGGRVKISEGQVTVWPSDLSASHIAVPGDPSQAAFWMVAASTIEGSEVVLPNIEQSTTRLGFVSVLRRMGASIGSESDGFVVSYNGRLQPTEIHAEEVPGLIDEVPILAVAAATASGTSVFHGLSELVHKESNRLDGVGSLVRALGADCHIDGDSISIRGTERFHSIEFSSRGDHRMAMSAAIGALLADGQSIIRDVACVDTSYPDFFTHLEMLTQ